MLWPALNQSSGETLVGVGRPTGSGKHEMRTLTPTLVGARSVDSHPHTHIPPPHPSSLHHLRTGLVSRRTPSTLSPTTPLVVDVDDVDRTLGSTGRVVLGGDPDDKVKKVPLLHDNTDGKSLHLRVSSEVVCSVTEVHFEWFLRPLDLGLSHYTTTLIPKVGSLRSVTLGCLSRPVFFLL